MSSLSDHILPLTEIWKGRDVSGKGPHEGVGGCKVHYEPEHFLPRSLTCFLSQELALTDAEIAVEKGLTSHADKLRGEDWPYQSAGQQTSSQQQELPRLHMKLAGPRAARDRRQVDQGFLRVK